MSISVYIESSLRSAVSVLQTVFPPRVLIALYVIAVMVLVFAITSVRVSATTIGYEIADISAALVSQEVEVESLRQEYDRLVSYEHLYDNASILGYGFDPQGVVDYYPDE